MAKSGWCCKMVHRRDFHNHADNHVNVECTHIHASRKHTDKESSPIWLLARAMMFGEYNLSYMEAPWQVSMMKSSSLYLPTHVKRVKGVILEWERTFHTHTRAHTALKPSFIELLLWQLRKIWLLPPPFSPFINNIFSNSGSKTNSPHAKSRQTPPSSSRFSFRSNVPMASFKISLSSGLWHEVPPLCCVYPWLCCNF